ncbi:MAG: aminoglycoside 3'-phosphotransferase [Micrococcales bacterium]|nr:aminoglycoside 3'-phosphotransferase [Micrococcales bacterium]
MPLASVPRGPVEVPDAVRARVREPEAVWRNMLGGLTFRDADGGRYLKWNPAGVDASLAVERERLTWAARFHPVPEVLEYAADETGELLVTRALPGEGAATDRWLAAPRAAVRAIGEGLRALHDDLPVDACPFEWSAQARLDELATDARAAVGDPPPVERLVVCHGDACAPNTIIGSGGRWVGHVDLESLGTADRWADLAVASMSLDWNYGEGWEPEFFAAYGIASDADRIRYYRALWNAG